MTAFVNAMAIKRELDREANALSDAEWEACQRIFASYCWETSTVDELPAKWNRGECTERLAYLVWIHGILCSLEDTAPAGERFLERDDLPRIAAHVSELRDIFAAERDRLRGRQHGAGEVELLVWEAQQLSWWIEDHRDCEAILALIASAGDAKRAA